MNHTRATTQAKELLKNQGIEAPPVDVRKIVKVLGISLAEAPHPNEDLSGLIMRDNEKTLIGVNASHGEGRKRFTIAHELGHFMLHRNKEVFIDREKNLFVRFRKKQAHYSLEEAEANAFAAELLMPEKWIAEDFKSLLSMIKESLGKMESFHYDFIVRSLAKKFCVSDEAMRIRLDNLSLVRK